jgi:hypothetical protein
MDLPRKNAPMLIANMKAKELRSKVPARFSLLIEKLKEKKKMDSQDKERNQKTHGQEEVNLLLILLK